AARFGRNTPSGAQETSGSIRLHARVTGTSSRPRLQGEAATAGASIGNLGVSRGQARFYWSAGERGEISVDAEGIRTPAGEFPSVEARLRVDGRGVEVAALRLPLSPGVLLAHGHVSRAGGLALQLTASGADAAALAARARQLSHMGNARGTIAFAGTLGGTLVHPVLEGQVDAENGALGNVAFEQLRAGLEVRNGGFAVRHLALRRGDETLAFSGHAQLGARAAPRVEGRLVCRSVEAAALARALGAAIDIEGSGSADLQLKGSPPYFGAQGELTVQGARIAGVALGNVRARLLREGGGIRLDPLEITDGDARLSAAGSAAADARLKVALEGRRVPLDRLARLAGLNLPLTGVLDFTGELSGTLAHPSVAMRATGGSAQLGALTIDSVAGNLTYANGVTRAEGVHLERGSTRYAVQHLEWNGPDQAIHLQGAVQHASLAELAETLGVVLKSNPQAAGHWSAAVNALPHPAEGQADLEITTTGPLNHLTGSAAI
ncbi:MAG: hypothetical protein QHJ73_18535, partial [Armatimonadota bacterium]|nr:hypothetical protein [Armatimonadota bacterium]